MDTFLYISDKYDKLQPKNINTDKYNQFHLQLFGIFIILYVLVRISELYLIPNIPSFLSSEFKSFIRISSVIVPSLFGISYLKNISA
jgi:hypothetical protein